jgi:homoserine O-succinyltransferase
MGIEELWHSPPDALIVTGAEPLAADLAGELYWSDLADLLTRAVEEIPSVLLSCLAAHAALQLFDDLERELLTAKCTGVFVQDHVVPHPLTKNLPSPLVFPHSRLNDVPSDALRTKGYAVLVGSQDAGWTVATRPSYAGELVLIQGHPEYDASVLLREYRRDVGRYLTRERQELPTLPAHFVAPKDEAALNDFHLRVITEHSGPELLAVLPFDEMMYSAPWPWRPAAEQFYANWITDVLGRTTSSWRTFLP